MEQVRAGDVIKLNGKQLIIEFDSDFDVEQYISDTDCKRVQLKFLDPRVISNEQRKKIFAMIKDISEFCSNDKEYTRSVLISEFCFHMDLELFSLSDVDMSTASNFIKYLVEFCLKHAVPLTDYLWHNCEDIQHYLYNCLKYKRCSVCGLNSEFHHCTGSRTGMGRDSLEIPLVGLKGMALCRNHHNEIHTDAEQVFYDRYHVEPVVVDELIASKYKHYKKEGK